MKAPDLFRQWRSEPHQERPTLTGDLLCFLSEHVLEAQLENGARVLDSTDFKEWLKVLAEEADREMA